MSGFEYVALTLPEAFGFLPSIMKDRGDGKAEVDIEKLSDGELKTLVGSFALIDQVLRVMGPAAVVELAKRKLELDCLPDFIRRVQ